VRLAERGRFVGVQRRVNTAKDDKRAALPCLTANLVAIDRVARVDTDAHDIARCNVVRIPRVERFVGDDRIAIDRRGRPGEDVQPTRRNHPNAERQAAGIDQMNLHSTPV
jgi:hypothetical protein